MAKEGPPPINWATRPTQSALISVGAQAASTAPHAALPTAPTLPAAPSNANCRSVTINRAGLGIIRPTPGLLPFPRSLLATQSATATSSTMDGQDRAIGLQFPRSLLATQSAMATSSNMDGQDRAVDSLAHALNGLSTNDVTQPAAATPPPPTPSVPVFVMPVNCHRGRTRYYAVIVGKCCGVYSSWSTVQPLVIGVSGSLYTGFPTYQAACDDYYAAKAAGHVRVVREPGDERIYGPLSQACM